MLMGHGLVLCEYELSTFRIERVIKKQASFFMTQKFRIFFDRKHRIFAGHDKSKILLRHASSEHLGIFFRALPGAARCARASPLLFHMARRVVAP